MKKIEVKEYSIVFADADQAMAEYLRHRQYTKIGILVDDHTLDHCLPRLTSLGDVSVISIKSGETYKTVDTCAEIWSQMQSAGFDRHSLLINLGGGVIGDMGGYAASCYMRGIDFVQVPTTLLSQVDASVGGKLAIDFNGIKNLIGLFRNPEMVIIDQEFLQTLPREELRSGYAEMLKHGLIREAHIWQDLTSGDWRDSNWHNEIYKSVRIKADVVTQDPFEKGLRKILNYGHTVGHAVETIAMSSDRPLLHGEAIAIGMMVEAMISVEQTGLSISQRDEVIRGLLSIYDDIDYTILQRSEDIIQIMTSDKKNKDGHIRSALLEKIGLCTYDHHLSFDTIKDGLQKTLQHIQTLRS